MSLGVRAAVLVALAGCGARSGLAVDAGGPEVVATDRAAAQDLPDVACEDGPISLQRRDFVALLAIDRSGSMSLDLQGNNGVPRRWDVLRAVLPRVLTAFDPGVSLGAMFFPAGGPSECAAPSGLTVPFAAVNGGAVAMALDTLAPTGRTPTYAALVQAERLLQAAPGEGTRAVILATDGGPNCNAALDGDRCYCAAAPVGLGQQQCRVDPSLCLDDRRTLAQVQAMAARGIATFVVGLDGDREPELVRVLRDLAQAGGRPNPLGGRGYYSVQRPEDLAVAVEGIGRSLARCTLRAASRPPALAQVELRVGDALTPRDPARVEGWDWSAPQGTDVVLFGRACDAVAAGAPVVMVARCGR